MPDSADLSQRLLAQLRFPCGDVPEPGDIKNVAPGIYWLRMPLPFQLNHINLWLVEDKDGWTIVDTGINTQRHARAVGEDLRRAASRQAGDAGHRHAPASRPCRAGRLAVRALERAALDDARRVHERHRRPQRLHRERGPARAPIWRATACRPTSIPLFHRHKGGYAKGVAPLPPAFQRLIHAHPITLGGHRWDVIVGRGHAPEHASLWCPELNVLIAGDQVLPKISTNVGVWPNEPHGRRADLVPRRLLALPPPAGRCAGAAEPRLSLHRPAHPARPARGPSRRAAERHDRGHRPHAAPRARPAGTWCRCCSRAISTTTRSSSPSARPWRICTAWRPAPA